MTTTERKVRNQQASKKQNSGIYAPPKKSNNLFKEAKKGKPSCKKSTQAKSSLAQKHKYNRKFYACGKNR
jgi:hypothetical protein